MFDDSVHDAELTWLSGTAWNYAYALLSVLLNNALNRLDAAKTENKEIAHKLFAAAAEFAAYQGESGAEIQTVLIYIYLSVLLTRL